MKVTVNMKPIVLTANTKDEVVSQVKEFFRTFGYTVNSHGKGMSRGNEFIMVNYQKFRSKRGVRAAHWVAYVYKFDMDFLKTANLKVTQGTRTFDIRSKMNCISCGKEMDLVLVNDNPNEGYAYNVYHCDDCMMLCRENVWSNSGEVWVKKEDVERVPK